MRTAMSTLGRRTMWLLLGGSALAAVLPAQPLESADRFELTVGDEPAAPVDDFSPADDARLAAATAPAAPP